MALHPRGVHGLSTFTLCFVLFCFAFFFFIQGDQTLQLFILQKTFSFFVEMCVHNKVYSPFPFSFLFFLYMHGIRYWVPGIAGVTLFFFMTVYFPLSSGICKTREYPLPGSRCRPCVYFVLCVVGNRSSLLFLNSQYISSSKKKEHS